MSLQEASSSALNRLLREGLLHLKRRTTDKALESFTTASDQFPTQSSAHLLKGIALARLNRAEETVNAVDKAIELAPTDVSVHVKAAKALVRVRRPYRALRYLEKIQAVQENDPVLLDLIFNIGLRVGWYWEAFAAIRKSIQAEPAQARRKVDTARILHNLRDHEAAIDLLEGVIDGPLVDSGAYYLYSEALQELGKVEKAVEAVNKALALQDHTPEALLQTAEKHIQLGALEDAESSISAALKIDPACKEAILARGNFHLWRGQTEDAKKIGQAILADHPEDAEARRIIAGSLVLEEKYEEARIIVDALIEENKQDVLALLWRGEIKRAHELFDEAIIDIDMGIIYSKGYTVQAHISRLLTILEQQMQSQGTLAQDAYAELLTLVKPLLPNPETDSECEGRPTIVRGLMHHAFASFEGNRTSETTYIRRDDESRTLKKLHVEAHSRFASRYLQELILTRPIEEVLDLFQNMVRSDPQNPIVYTHLGEIYLWLGRYKESLVEFKKSIAITPQVRWAYIGLCANEMLLGRYNAAIQWCNQGLKAFPPPGRTMFPYRAETYRRMGKLPEALEDITKSIQMTPGRMSGWMNHALIQHELGDSQYLLSSYNKVLERTPCLIETALEEQEWPFSMNHPVPEKIPDFYEGIFTMMRGNRSSDFVTYFTHDDRFRFVPPPDIPDPVFN